MSKKANAVCLTCGKPYYKCMSCDQMKSAGLYTWRSNCDTVECFKIMMIALDFRDGKIDIKEAKNQLSMYDVDNILTSETGVRDILEPVLNYTEPIIEEVVDDILSDTYVEDED